MRANNVTDMGLNACKKCRIFVVLLVWVAGEDKKEIPEIIVVSGIFHGGRYRTRTYDLPHVMQSGLRAGAAEYRPAP